MSKKKGELTAKERLFVEQLVQGVAQAEAYRKAFGASGKSASAINSNASRLAKKDKVLQYRHELEERAASSTVATVQEIREFHTAVMRTPIGSIDESSPLCQSVTVTDTSRTLKMPDKLKAASELTKMLGGYEAEKKEVELSGSLDVPSIVATLKSSPLT